MEINKRAENRHWGTGGEGKNGNQTSSARSHINCSRGRSSTFLSLSEKYVQIRFFSPIDVMRMGSCYEKSIVLRTV